jgi:L-alanine-DL-glutamate epimerase-like enolase superfamily enzyme
MKLFDYREAPNGTEQGKLLKERMEKGYTFLKVDFGINLLRNIPGTLSRPLGPQDDQAYRMTMHPFTGIEITDKGIAILSDYVAAIREVIGMEVPLASDHFGHIGVNSCIRLARAMEKHQLAWMEDMIPWQFTELLKKINDSVAVPILTGEDIYLKEEFVKIVNAKAVNMIAPDLATSGGILETKKIGDLAMEGGVPMAIHFAGTPVLFMASVHCAAATENFLCLYVWHTKMWIWKAAKMAGAACPTLKWQDRKTVGRAVPAIKLARLQHNSRSWCTAHIEHHSVDVPWWEDLVTGVPKPIVKGGFVAVPEKPGLGIELNEEVIKRHLMEPGYFEPTPEWDKERSNDHLWS